MEHETWIPNRIYWILLTIPRQFLFASYHSLTYTLNGMKVDPHSPTTIKFARTPLPPPRPKNFLRQRINGSAISKSNCVEGMTKERTGMGHQEWQTALVSSARESPFNNERGLRTELNDRELEHFLTIHRTSVPYSFQSDERNTWLNPELWNSKSYQTAALGRIHPHSHYRGINAAHVWAFLFRFSSSQNSNNNNSIILKN